MVTRHEIRPGKYLTISSNALPADRELAAWELELLAPTATEILFKIIHEHEDSGETPPSEP